MFHGFMYQGMGLKDSKPNTNTEELAQKVLCLCCKVERKQTRPNKWQDSGGRDSEEWEGIRSERIEREREGREEEGFQIGTLAEREREIHQWRP